MTDQETPEQVERRNRWFRLALELGKQDDFLALLAHERQMMPVPRWDQLPNRYGNSREPDDEDRAELADVLGVDMVRKLLADDKPEGDPT